MFGPTLVFTYHPPQVRLGRRVWCRYRSAWCKVTSITDAKIPWPRVQPEGQRGGSGLWVNATLERAIRSESAESLKHWFGVSQACVHDWRKWAGVDGWTKTPGSRRLHREASLAGADATRGRTLTTAECDRRSERAKALDLIRHAREPRWAGKGWTGEMDALLGTAPDAVLADRWGKTANAVRVRRRRLGIPAPAQANSG